MIKFLSIGFTVLSFSVSAQGWYPAGSRSMSMANASTALTDVWSYFNNPGSVAELKEIQFAASYENRFLLRELQSQAFVGAIPLKTGVISVGGHQYGYDQFRSYKAGLGYSLPLGDHFFAGVQLNYQGIRLNENYGSKSTLTAEIGMLVKISDSWSVGLSAFNIGRQLLMEKPEDRFTTLMRLGTAYRFSDKFLLSVEVAKDTDYKPRVSMGMEYEIIDEFFWRMGFATGRPEFTFGFGYHFNRIHLDLGSAYDQILGWSPNFSLAYIFKKD